MRVLTLSVLLFLVAAGYGQSHDLYLGHIMYRDVPLYTINDYKYGFPLFVRSNLIEYPEEGITNFAYITAIVIKDHYKDGTGGFASVVAGGVGQRFAKIKLKSQRNHGYNFTVTIYGRF